MRLLSNLHVKDKPAVLPDPAILRQFHYFIYRPRIKHMYLALRSRDRVVGILSRQRAGKAGNRDSIYRRGNRFISSLSVQIIAGVHPASYVMVNVVYLFGGKAAEA